MKAGSHPVGKAVSRMIADAHGEILHLSVTYSPKQILNNCAEAVGRVIKFFKILAPNPQDFSVPAFTEFPTDFERKDREYIEDKAAIAIALGLVFTAGVGTGVVLAGTDTGAATAKTIAVVGTGVSTICAGAAWIYNKGEEYAKSALDVMIKYISPFNHCMKRHHNNIERVKTCLMKDYELKIGEVTRFIVKMLSMNIAIKQELSLIKDIFYYGHH